VIAAAFPALFAEFPGKRFALLWRGIRDGFHGASTSTRPLWQWNGKFGSEKNLPNADLSPRSFLSGLKNPHNFPFPFALKAEKNDHAIHDYP
jgi:hypothetical protein